MLYFFTPATLASAEVTGIFSISTLNKCDISIQKTEMFIAADKNKNSSFKSIVVNFNGESVYYAFSSISDTQEGRSNFLEFDNSNISGRKVRLALEATQSCLESELGSQTFQNLKSEKNSTICEIGISSSIAEIFECLDSLAGPLYDTEIVDAISSRY